MPFLMQEMIHCNVIISVCECGMHRFASVIYCLSIVGNSYSNVLTYLLGVITVLKSSIVLLQFMRHHMEFSLFYVLLILN